MKRLWSFTIAFVILSVFFASVVNHYFHSYEVVVSVEPVDFPSQLTGHTVIVKDGFGMGGGICIASDYILTCAHNVLPPEMPPDCQDALNEFIKEIKEEAGDGASVIIELILGPDDPTIWVSDSHDCKVKATVTKIDKTVDLAVLKLESCLDVNPVEFDDSNLKVGESVFNIGHWLDNTFCYGEGILAKDKVAFPLDRAHYISSTPTMLGCSGTGLFRKSGKCIGLVDLAFPSGHGCAIPAYEIKNFLSDVEF